MKPPRRRYKAGPRNPSALTGAHPLARPRMLDPYENILIGNFLYSLGARIGARCVELGIEATGSVCLLQQTPLDGLIGDVYLRYPGVIRILEFKRSSNTSPKELAKHTSLCAALGSADYSGLERLSRRVHWYVESVEADPVWTTHACPYIDMAKALTGTEPDLGWLTDDFARAAVGRVEPEFVPADVVRYLQAIALFAGTKGTSSSGIVVAVDGTGTVRWLPLQSVRDLRLDLSAHKANTRYLVAAMGEARAKAHEAELALQVEQARERTATRRRNLKRDRGPSL